MSDSPKTSTMPLTPDDAASAPGPTEWGEGRHGVGPWREEHPGEPLPTDPRYDPQLLAEGDRRNVVDAYRHPFHVAIENFEHDANIGTVVRTANAFLAETVHIVGRRRWNRRGAMVTDRYQHLQHHDTVEELIDWAHENGLTVVAVDNVPGSTPIETATLPERSLLLFGQEGPGISDASEQQADMVVSIAQFGSTRSINVGVAAGIVMHTWITEHADSSTAW